MSLIPSWRHTPRDLEHWASLEAHDRVLARSPLLDRRIAEAEAALLEFAAQGQPLQVSVSWGKDSVVVAHLAVGLALGPVVWYPAGRIENPDCAAVRDAFLAKYPTTQYLEIEAALSSEDWNRALGHDGAQAEFEVASRALSRRYVCGVRAEESATRRRAVGRHGLVSRNTCRPIGHWSGLEVFAYLARHDLPVHPAYAMTMGGTLDRGRVRVGTIGGVGGAGFGRAQWERAYYPDVVAALGLARR
jgi:phosphoadenosine phosphosulfate reductase